MSEELISLRAWAEKQHIALAYAARLVHRRLLPAERVLDKDRLGRPHWQWVVNRNEPMPTTPRFALKTKPAPKVGSLHSRGLSVTEAKMLLKAFNGQPHFAIKTAERLKGLGLLTYTLFGHAVMGKLTKPGREALREAKTLGMLSGEEVAQ